ncbi:hypothetical protein BKA69DRAFT_824263 [Paraphysoderma sedebokerense]|nr:hypothetical protein BKA69DRAFT_824263 [Paraphysoderma sedebokerense]
MKPSPTSSPPKSDTSNDKDSIQIVIENVAADRGSSPIYHSTHLPANVLDQGCAARSAELSTVPQQGIGTVQCLAVATTHPMPECSISRNWHDMPSVGFPVPVIPPISMIGHPQMFPNPAHHPVPIQLNNPTYEVNTVPYQHQLNPHLYNPPLWPQILNLNPLQPHPQLMPIAAMDKVMPIFPNMHPPLPPVVFLQTSSPTDVHRFTPPANFHPPFDMLSIQQVQPTDDSQRFIRTHDATPNVADGEPQQSNFRYGVGEGVDTRPSSGRLSTVEAPSSAERGILKTKSSPARGQPNSSKNADPGEKNPSAPVPEREPRSANSQSVTNKVNMVQLSHRSIRKNKRGLFSIWIDSIPPDTRKEELTDFFLGWRGFVDLFYESRTHSAYINFASPEDAEDAIRRSAIKCSEVDKNHRYGDLHPLLISFKNAKMRIRSLRDDIPEAHSNQSFQSKRGQTMKSMQMRPSERWTSIHGLPKYYQSGSQTGSTGNSQSQNFGRQQGRKSGNYNRDIVTCDSYSAQSRSFENSRRLDSYFIVTALREDDLKESIVNGIFHVSEKQMVSLNAVYATSCSVYILAAFRSGDGIWGVGRMNSFATFFDSSREKIDHFNRDMAFSQGFNYTTHLSDRHVGFFQIEWLRMYFKFAFD